MCTGLQGAQTQTCVLFYIAHYTAHVFINKFLSFLLKILRLDTCGEKFTFACDFMLAFFISDSFSTVSTFNLLLIRVRIFCERPSKICELLNILIHNDFIIKSILKSYIDYKLIDNHYC